MQGSLGALQIAMAKVTEEAKQVSFTTLLAGTGAITESDVNFAAASGAIMIGFNVRPDAAAKRAADASRRGYPLLRCHLPPGRRHQGGDEGPAGAGDARGDRRLRRGAPDLPLPNRDGRSPGLYVLDGKAVRNVRVRVLRYGTVVHDGTVGSLKRFKDDVREVAAGYECGLSLDSFNDFQEGDQLEFYHVEKVARTA